MKRGGAQYGRGRRTARGVVAVLPLLYALSGCTARTPGAERFPELEDHAGSEVVALRFVAPAPFSADSLAELIETEATHCDLLGLGFCLPFTDIGEETVRLDLNLVAQDVDRLALFYRRSGFLGTRVLPDVDVRGEDAVAVSFIILRGDSVLVDSLLIEGAEEVLDTAAIRRKLPLAEGDLFDTDEFLASADTLLAALHERGHANAEVLRNYAADTVSDRATVWLVAIPGPVVRVDSIIVRGGGRLGRTNALRQLAVREGALLRARDLSESQRNLFSLDLIQFATVTVAPDSLQQDTASASETVLVQISETPVYLVEAAAGYGTVDCMRAQTRWTSRSFMGGARRLVLSGSVSKLGIGQPLDLGLSNSMCRAYRDDEFGNTLDYRVAADLNQPYFLSPLNRLNGTLFAERQSEPSLYQRQAYGAEAALTRRLHLRDIIGFAAKAEYRRTLASEAVYCFALAVCQESELLALGEFHWRNAVSATYLRDRANSPIDPSRGYIARFALEYAPNFFGTKVDFARLTVEGSRYFPIGRDWVLATRLRIGDFLGTAHIVPDGDVDVGELLPPEERFYAGGATTVRGYGRNEMGTEEASGVYVAEQTRVNPEFGGIPKGFGPQGDIAFVPLGGTAVAIASAELRMPAPFLSDLLGLAFFVDAGALSTGSVIDIEFQDLRYTPGAGLRIRTPVGPARFDVAIRPHGPPTAPLLAPDPLDPDRLIQIDDNFARDESGLFRRLQFHLAVGQAF
ncbi:MAG TPA: BamA/TamA family outer membrane protein [Longimicrobiales bacterium]|nr:BamA/TamA family outer membrane protein [Longimicrobiales bacterium]